MTASSTSDAPVGTSPQFAVALGGGGARGFAHILVAEALDELGVRPSRIAGTSIGALIGSAWAGGMSGKEIRSYVTTKLHDRTQILKGLMQARAGSLADFFRGQMANPVLLDAEKVLALFWPPGLAERFEDMTIPLDVIATDFYGRRQKLFNSGNVQPAVSASMAIPGVFRPVSIGGRAFVDGGIVNPLPYNHLIAADTFVIACDVTGGPVEGKRPSPLPLEALLGASQIMQSSITGQMLQASQPNLLLVPQVDQFKILDFFRATKIMDASEPLKDEIKRAVEHLVEG